MHPLFLPLCPIIFQTHTWSLYPSPPSVSQLPGEAAALQARVRCCPMCAAEGANPRAGGGVQGARGGHGVCTQGSRNGHRRGKVGGQISSCFRYQCVLYLKGLHESPLIPLLHMSMSNTVPAPVQESPLELFHHPTWDKCIWQSYEPRYPHIENASWRITCWYPHTLGNSHMPFKIKISAFLFWIQGLVRRPLCMPCPQQPWQWLWPEPAHVGSWRGVAVTGRSGGSALRVSLDSIVWNVMGKSILSHS